MKSPKTHIPAFVRRPGRRGSTILIVLALLSVLVLIATTLTFTSRLEVISSQNFSRGIESRAAAVSSIQQVAGSAAENLDGEAASKLDFAMAAMNPEMLEHMARQLSGSEGHANSKAHLAHQMSASGIRTTSAIVNFADASARLNLNTADAAALTRLFALVFDRHALDLPAEPLAKAIISHREGISEERRRLFPAEGNSPRPANQRGRSLADTWEEVMPGLTALSLSSAAASSSRELPFIGRPQWAYVPPEMKSPDGLHAFFEGRDDRALRETDIRLPARNGERRFSSVDELLYLDGFTREAIQVLRPYLTVYSATAPRLINTGGEKGGIGGSPLDLNRASAEEIYDALSALYGGAKEDNLLRQFAVNIVDFRDGNGERTSLPDTTGAGAVLGLERTPLITEVYANSVTPAQQGNDGQFVEIYNPWPDAISLEGWTLEAGGRTFPLQGILPSRGFLIVTDDYDNSADPGFADELPGQGSFYDIFGLVAAGAQRRVLEHPDLMLPHGNGLHQVEMRGRGGALADRFSYRVTDAGDVFNSFQRPAIFVDEAVAARPTPFSLSGLDATLDERTAERIRMLPKDGPFVDVLELFNVFAGYANPGGQEGRRWGFPVLATPLSRTKAQRDLANDPTRIDARIIDIFTVESLERPGYLEIAEGRAALHRLPSGRLGEGEVTPTRDKSLIREAAIGTTARGVRHGMININTAPATVLRAIGFDDVQADRIVSARAELEEEFLRGSRNDWVSWRRLSDALADERIWGRIDGEDPRAVLERAGPVFRQLSTGSSAFFLEGQAVSTHDSDRPARGGITVQALVALDRERPDLLWWRFSP